MSFTRWMQVHRRSILFLLFASACGGAVAAFGLPVTLFPDVDFPRVLVSLDAGDRPAEQMLLQVTVPVEEAVRRVPGIADVRSVTSRGSAEISINFDWGTPMAEATLQVNSAISQILPTLPPGIQLLTRRMDPTVFPIIAFSVTSPTLDPATLRDIAQYQLRPLLSSVSGVARIGVVGGAIAEYQIAVDPARLRTYGLAMNDVTQSLGAANVIQAVGRLEDHYKLYLVVSDTRLHDVDQIRRTVLKTGENGIVDLDDVSDVTMGTRPQWIRVNADGRNAVLLNVYQQIGGNSVRISREINARLDSYQSQLPPGVKIANWYDQSQLVVQSAVSVRDAILIGIGLAALVLLFFLRNVKITLIAVLVVPAALATTMALLSALDMSFNVMTLGGMAAAVGLIIDDAIVMTEHIVRRLRESPQEHHGRVLSAALEFIRPLAGSSAATIVIFLPLAFLTGVAGAFFKALSITMGSALVFSFLITWLGVPILADRFLNEKDAHQKEGGILTLWMHRGYAYLMRRLFNRPALLLAGLAPLLLAGWLAFRNVGSGFMPAMDEGGFVLDYRTAPGTALSETDRLLRQVEQIIKATPEVETYSRRTGTALGGGLVEANEGDFFVRLKPAPRRAIDEVMDDVRTRVERTVPGLDVEMAQLMEDMIGDLTAVPQPVEIKLFSDQPAELQAAARSVAARIKGIAGVVGVRDGIVPAGDALVIHVDRVKAALEGVDPDAITRTLDTYLDGTVATEVQTQLKMIGVRAWIPFDLRRTDQDVGNLLIPAPDGHAFPLRRVATIETVSGQPQITRENLKRMVAVTARISGRDLGSVIRDIRTSLAVPGLLPKGMYYDLGGLYRQQQIAFNGLMQVFAAAVGLVFALLLFMYERFRIVLSIMALPLLAVAAAFIGLWATGVDLNISAMMGLTMTVGIVTEVAIFYFSEYRDEAEERGLREALIEAGKNRMRPIAMTTFAAILTLLPLALALGEGSAMQKPLAIVIISGLIVQLPLVLVAMPVLYYVMQRKGAASWIGGH